MAGFEPRQVWAMRRAGQVGDRASWKTKSGKIWPWGTACWLFAAWGHDGPVSLGPRLQTPPQKPSPKWAGTSRISTPRCSHPPGSSCIPHPDHTGFGMSSPHGLWDVLTCPTSPASAHPTELGAGYPEKVARHHEVRGVTQQWLGNRDPEGKRRWTGSVMELKSVSICPNMPTVILKQRLFFAKLTPRDCPCVPQPLPLPGLGVCRTGLDSTRSWNIPSTRQSSGLFWKSGPKPRRLGRWQPKELKPPWHLYLAEVFLPHPRIQPCPTCVVWSWLTSLLWGLNKGRLMPFILW